MRDTKLFGGGSTRGSLVFEVQEGKMNLVLIYAPWLESTRVYLAVE